MVNWIDISFYSFTSEMGQDWLLYSLS
jgi:hypothetical protein